MFVHGKSVNSGPANGLISLNASISKSGESGNIDRIKKFQAENDHSIEHSNNEFKRLEEKLRKASSSLITRGNSILNADNILKEAKVAMEEFNPLISTV